VAGKLLTEKELCEWLQISKPTAWRWRREGLPYLRHGSTIRYDEDEVLLWLRENEIEDDEEE
jgi:excisionase family DNA binding protein